jgi:tRNA pseudouridine32 synthase / 23S rRNA pseudouridine746 synthase
MTDSKDKILNVKFTCANEDDGLFIVDIIAKTTSLSKSLIKKVMANGSVFQTFKKNRKHVRKARTTAKAGDLLECYYDPNIDLDGIFEFNLLFETKNYGIYHKPAGAMTEGNNYGDKTSLIRYVEKLKRDVYLVNRLDREIEGLVLVAYNSRTQNFMQEMWREGVIKKYQAIVLGHLEGRGYFDKKINNKFTKTIFTCVDSKDNRSYIEIEAVTERKYQIRKHFADNGNPIIGDPIYGANNKNNNGLMLISYSLEFKDPHDQKHLKVELPKERMLFFPSGEDESE